MRRIGFTKSVSGSVKFKPESSVVTGVYVLTGEKITVRIFEVRLTEQGNYHKVRSKKCPYNLFLNQSDLSY